MMYQAACFTIQMQIVSNFIRNAPQGEVYEVFNARWFPWV